MNLKLFTLLLVITIVTLPAVISAEDAMVDMIGAMTKPEGITEPMGRWEKFLNGLELIGLNIGFWFLVILFFGLVYIIVMAPIALYPVFKQHKNNIGRLMKFQWK